MKCPKCEHVQPDGAAECAACGVIFAKWQDHWDRPVPGHTPGTRVATSAPSAPSRGGLRVALKMAGLLGAAAGWYWFMAWAPGGLPVTEQAYGDSENGFAVTAPEGWTATKTRNCKNTGTPLTSATICQVLDVSRDGPGRPGPTLQVIVAPVRSLFKTGWGGSVRITEDRKDQLAQAVQQTLGSLPGYTPEIAEVVSIDRVTAFRVRGAATIRGTPVMIGDKMMTLPNLGARTPERHVAMTLVLVPGGSRAYLITFASEAQEEPALRPLVDEAVQSFRITSGRATPFQAYGGLMGGMPGDAILGGLVGLTLALLKL